MDLRIDQYQRMTWIFRDGETDSSSNETIRVTSTSSADDASRSRRKTNTKVELTPPADRHMLRSCVAKMNHDLRRRYSLRQSSRRRICVSRCLTCLENWVCDSSAMNEACDFGGSVQHILRWRDARWIGTGWSSLRSGVAVILSNMPSCWFALRLGCSSPSPGQTICCRRRHETCLRDAR